MKYVTLRVWHPDCWMLEMSEHNPDVCIESRGVCAHAGVVQAGALVRSEHHEAVRSALADPVPTDVHREVLSLTQGAAEVYSHYPTYRSMYEATMSSGFLLASPVLHHQGFERWEVLADSNTLAAGIAKLREVAEVRVDRVSETRAPNPPVRPEPLGALGEDLSERQFDVLRRAVEAGYYEWPRGKNVKRLAAELGISGPTCLEHIRRAESRIVPAVVRELARTRRQQLEE